MSGFITQSSSRLENTNDVNQACHWCDPQSEASYTVWQKCFLVFSGIYLIWLSYSIFCLSWFNI